MTTRKRKNSEHSKACKFTAGKTACTRSVKAQADNRAALRGQ